MLVERLLNLTTEATVAMDGGLGRHMTLPSMDRI